MRRFLQTSARSFALAVSSSNRGQPVAALELAHSLGQRLAQPQRALSLARVQYKQRGSSSVGDGEDGNKSNKKKKGLWEMASEKFNVGVKTRSSSGRQPDSAGTSKSGPSVSDPGRGSSDDNRPERRHEDGHDFDARSGRSGRDQKRPSTGSDAIERKRRTRDGAVAGSSSPSRVGQLEHESSSGRENGRGESASRGSKPVNHRAASSVRHDQNNKRFVLDLGEGQMARIDYKPAGKGRIDLYHTEVPEELRGRGIGRSLAKGALEAASAANLKLKVTCEYLEDYLKRNSKDKYKKLLE